MKNFHYLRDPLFLVSCAAFLLNQYVVKAHFPHAPRFFFWHFNDCFTIPCALPPLLWLQRRFKLRDNDRPPTLGEVTSHLIFFSLFFKWFAPHFLHRDVADPWDVLAFSAGAIIAYFVWHYRLPHWKNRSRDFSPKETKPFEYSN